MPIEGPTFPAAMRNYQDHLNGLLTHTITQVPLIVLHPRRAGRAQIAFRDRGGPARAPLDTRYGRLEFYLGQVCEDLVTTKGRHRIQTIGYEYWLFAADSRDPVLRWEYVKRPRQGARWCRHHLQGPVQLTLGARRASLNNWHLPTGYVPLEEILRFCIVDLEVTPLSPSTWDTELQASYSEFRRQLAELV